MERTIFDAIGRYFWLICLAISGYQYLAASRRIDSEEDLDDSARAERLTYVQRSIGLSTIPWWVMGLGQVTGSTSTVWEYFRPQDMNPFVLGFVGSVFAMSLAVAYWVFLRGGARKTIEFKLMHAQGFSGSKPLTERQVKLFAGFGPLFVLAWIALCIFIDAPIRK